MSDVQVEQIIHTQLLRRGEGKTMDDPVRIIEQYWTLDGRLLFEFDSTTRKFYSEIYKVRE